MTIYFGNIRTEEFKPGYAVSSFRHDLLLKKEKIVIKVKKTRKFVGAKKRVHSDYDKIIFFVYDPECWIDNTKGLIDDLESKDNEVKVRVIIAQF